ncbi:hypothetical protein IB238_04400 [Rhizobium sp. ARZ01]|uniref:hypothetical protein n=1 Tax=Rhizobium sp. ARZ01 TaxID=2769313 RepID=UPI001786AE85|nr:hypothetical protein [Rhizobium sp. ARZ01]MBD9371881.1 hypothetical protein [Rhizobium sp. ARZ01]
MKAVPTLAMTAFFAALALNIAIPAVVLLSLAAVREIGLAMGTVFVSQGRTV